MSFYKIFNVVKDFFSLGSLDTKCKKNYKEIMCKRKELYYKMYFMYPFFVFIESNLSLENIKQLNLKIMLQINKILFFYSVFT